VRVPSPIKWFVAPVTAISRAAVLILMFALGALLPSFQARADKAARPNIVLIMADDMGYSDIGCYGGEVQTPNLDGLARSGLRFTQFYNTARCCPTRACLMTGLYPHQAGVGHMMNDRGYDGYRGDLNQSCVTIAEVLSTAGYSTYMSGKWHVTPVNEKKHNWPLQRGYDRFFGTIHGAGSFYDPNSLTRDNEFIAPESEDFFYTDAISENAATFIREHDRKQPFFMYVAYTSPHWPMHARPENIAKYKGVYDKGWDAIRDERYKRMVQMGLIDSSCQMSSRDSSAPAWQDERLKEWNIRCMEVYAAMIDCMDQGIGQILDSLKETDQYDNTLIFFLADNGGCAEGMGRGPKVTYRDSEPDKLKSMEPGEFQTQMIPRRTRDGRALKQGQGVMPGPADTYIGYGLPWANVSNTPFRRYKHWVHEGGISTPLIVHWPEHLKAKSEFRTEPAHLIDIMPTCVEVAGAEYPKEYKGHEITPHEGVSLVAAFENKSLARSQPIFWEHEGNRAVREGEWKLVARGAKGPWELYDMEADRTELNDLSSKMPDRVKKMAQQWETWALRAQAKPWPYAKSKKPAQSKKVKGKKS